MLFTNLKKYTSTHHLYIKIYIRKLIKCFSNDIPINFISDFVLVIDEKGYDKDYQKSDTEIETYESIELKYPQEYEDGGIIIPHDLNEKEMNDPRVQAMLKRSRGNNLLFIISQDYYELPKRTIRSNGNIYHIFKPNYFRDVQNLYHDKASMDITFNEFKLLTSIFWNQRYQALTIDVTEDKYTGRYRLGLNSLFIPDTNLF